MKLRAWRSLLETYSRILARIYETLRIETDLDIKSYDALLHTYEAGMEGIRMADLADRVLLSKSGLTALVDRLEERGLLRRLPDPADRRATRITITDGGIASFRAAAAVDLAAISRYFADRITDEEAETLIAALGRVREGSDGD